MKADKILKQYAAGERNFRGANLRGQSFKGQDLSDADFSEADIRGTDFTKTNLMGANFTQAKAGLQRRWVTGLVVLSLALSALSGFLSAHGGNWIRYLLDGDLVKYVTIIPSLILIEVYLIFLFIVVNKGLAKETVVFILIVILGLIATTTILMSSTQAFNAIWLTFAVIAFASFALTAPLVLTVALSMSLAVGNSLTMVSTSITANIVSVGAAVILGIKENIVLENVVGAVAMTITGMLPASYISSCAIFGEKKYGIFRTIAIAFAAIGGTSFRKANLTEANFTQATLKSTDLRGAILTRTSWYEAQKLDYSRLGTTYLRDAEVRQLLIKREGQNKNFDYQDLRGINLQEAKLAVASFIGADLSGANLQDTDLSGAKLVQTQLNQANLTGATLTGAILEDWGITSNTKLDGVRCEYVFMRVPTKEDSNPRRKPDNWEETFKHGDFADFIKPIVDTLDLYHNQGVDPRAIAISFKQLAENHPEAELEIVAMEKRGKDKFLLRAATAPDADHSALSAEYFITYNQLKALAERELQALIEEKDSRIRSLENMIVTALKRPSFYAKSIHNSGEIEIMSQGPKKVSKFDLQNAQFGGGLVDAEIVNARQIGGNITNYTQQQNLAEAAAEIQQLLAQLQSQGYNLEDAQREVASDLATQAQSDAEAKSKLVRLGQYLGDAAANGVIGDVAVEVIKLALRLAGIGLL